MTVRTATDAAGVELDIVRDPDSGRVALFDPEDIRGERWLECDEDMVVGQWPGAPIVTDTASSTTTVSGVSRKNAGDSMPTIRYDCESPSYARCWTMNGRLPSPRWDAT